MSKNRVNSDGAIPGKHLGVNGSPAWAAGGGFVGGEFSSNPLAGQPEFNGSEDWGGYAGRDGKAAHRSDINRSDAFPRPRFVGNPLATTPTVTERKR
jgi:hypothetical protein